MSPRRRSDRLFRVIRIIAGIGLVAYAAQRSVLVTAAVLVTIAVLSVAATPRRKLQSRHNSRTRDIGVASALTLLIWGGIVTAFLAVDSADPDLLERSFYGGLTISSIAVICALTVAGTFIAWYSFTRERRGRRAGRNSRRVVAGEPGSTDKPAEAVKI